MSGATAGQDPPLISDLRYEELSVGRRWGPFEERLAADASDRLRGAIGSRSQASAAPPGVLPVLSLWGLRRALRGIPAGGILTHQTFTSYGELPREGNVSIDVTLVGQRRSRSGLYSTFVFAFSRGGAPAAVAEWVILEPAADMS